jgi:hypothetical protein
MDPVADARDLVRARFPDALAAFLGGSALTAQRTSTSDLDVVVVVAGPPAPCRESLTWRGWPVELFIHDEQTLARWFGRDSARRRPTLARMCAQGAVLVGGAGGGPASRVRGQAAAVLAAGPPPLAQAELDRRRYGLSDLLDDLAGSTDPGETFVICWNVLVHTAELALLESGRWLGSGKWLLRELRALDAGFADQLIAAREDPAPLTGLADDVLRRAGGRLWEGYREAGKS